MRVRIGAPVVLAVCSALLFAVPAAAAETLTVTRHDDPPPGDCRPHDCSLREAVTASNDALGKATIVLPSSTKPYKLSITGGDEDLNATGDLDIFDDVTITHQGKGRATIDGQKIDRVFEALTPATFRNLVITGGKAVTLPYRSAKRLPTNLAGGAIRAQAKIKVLGSVLRGNKTGFVGGAISAETDPVILRDSTLDKNKADGSGGALYVERGATIDSSTISGNSAGNGGGIEVYDGYLQIENSTLTGNRAGSEGGAIAFNFGAGSFNSTTIADNVAGLNGPTYTGGIATGWAMVIGIGNSIVVGNHQANGPETDCGDAGATSSLGHNLFGKGGGCGGFSVGTDRTTKDAKLGKLSSNGGPTKTMALQKHSPAIGHGSKSSSPKRDQRGQRRDKHPDIGAYER